MRPGCRPWQLVTVVAVLAAACAGHATGAPLPPGPRLLDVAMVEYRFEHPPELPAGRVVLRVHNRGRLRHQLFLVRLPPDLKGSFDDQLHSAVRRVVETVDALAGVGPRESGVFAADLAPGRYGFACFLTDADGVAHALKGMNSELRVR